MIIFRLVSASKVNSYKVGQLISKNGKVEMPIMDLCAYGNGGLLMRDLRQESKPIVSLLNEQHIQNSVNFIGKITAKKHHDDTKDIWVNLAMAKFYEALWKTVRNAEPKLKEELLEIKPSVEDQVKQYLRVCFNLFVTNKGKMPLKY
jgi:hypothetical protein